MRPILSALPVPSSRLLFLGAFGVIYGVWGSTYLAARIAVQGLPPLLLVAARAVPAGVLLLLYARLSRPAAGADGPRWRDALIGGVLLFAFGQGALMRALQGVPSGLAAVFVATVPLWVLALGRATGQVRTRWVPAEVAGVAVGLLGVGLLTAPWSALAGTTIAPLDTLVLLFCALSWAAGTLFIRGSSLAAYPLRGTAMQLVAGGSVALAAGLATGERAALGMHSLAPSILGSLVYLSLAGSLLGFLAYGWLLTQTTATRVATYAYVNPVVAIAIGWAVGGESLSTRIALAVLVTLVGVALVVRRPRPAPVPAEEVAVRDAPDPALVSQPSLALAGCGCGETRKVAS